MRYRIALCGFSAFEYRALHFSFLHPAALHKTAYEVVEAIGDADFAVVDADSDPAVKGVVLSGRVASSVFVGAVPPDGAMAHLPRPIDPNRILLLLDELIVRGGDFVPTERLELVSEPEWAALDDDVAETGPVPVPATDERRDATHPPSEGVEETSGGHALARDTASTDAPAASTGTPPATLHSGPGSADKAAARAAARAKARRARLASRHAGLAGGELLRDVLVLDADVSASATLCALLDRFGFTVHAVTSVARAADCLALRPYAAIFLDIPLNASDGGAGLALMQFIDAMPALPDHPAPAVMLVTAALNPADRVRAALAGVGTPLVKPVGRGDVARALESRGVALPADARGV